MSGVLEPMRGALEGGASADELAELAERLLADAGAVADDAADSARAFAAMRAEYAGIEAITAGAWQRYPDIVGGGLHRSDADPRAMPLYATVQYIRRAGLYLPEDLGELRDSERVPAAWLGRESVRLAAFLVALRALIGRLDRNEIELNAYPDAVTDLAARFGKMTVATG